MSQTQVEPQLIQVGVGGLQVSSASFPTPGVGLEQAFLKIQSGIGQAAGHDETLGLREAFAGR